MEIQQERPPYVMFETRAVEDRTRSIDEGIWATKDVDYALITPMGSKDRTERVVVDWFSHLQMEVSQQRFPGEWLTAYKGAYKAWKEDREIPLEGTPIRTWSAASPAQCKMLLDLQVRTVEDLAAANEETVARIGMGGRALKQQAQAWLDSASNVGKVSAEVAALRVQNEALEARNEELLKRLDRLEAALTAAPGPQAKSKL